MAITGATTATVVADDTLTEWIDLAMRLGVRAPFLYQNFVYMPPTLKNTKRWSPNTWARLNASSSYPETDTVTAQALTPTAVDIDTSLYATGVFLGDWGSTLALENLVPGAVDALMDAVGQRLNTDAFGLASSMTNTIGSATTVMDVDNFVTVASSFRTQAKKSTRKPLMLLSEVARRDLHRDTMANGGGIYSSIIGVSLHETVKGANQGEWTEWGGYMIASSEDVPTVSSAKGNFVVHLDSPEACALGLPFSMDIRIEPARRAENVGMYLIASHAHAAGIVEQARALRFDTRAA